MKSLRSIKKSKGLAAIEFTLIMLGFFAPLLLGSVEIGRVLYNYNTIVKSVREATRYMSVQSATSSTYSSKVTAAKCLVVYGNEACTGTVLVSGLATSMVTVGENSNGTPLSTGTTGSVTFKVITVKVSGFSLGYVTTFFGSTKAFNTISASMRQATS